MKWDKGSPAVTAQYHPLSVCSLLLAVQNLFTLNFKIKLMSNSKTLDVIFGQNNKSEV